MRQKQPRQIYKDALGNPGIENETEEFINSWKIFDERCEAINEKLKLRVFKIYSYITRGEQGIKSSEIGLRDFFEKMSMTDPDGEEIVFQNKIPKYSL